MKLPAPYLVLCDFLEPAQQTEMLAWTLTNEARFNMRSVREHDVELVHKYRLDDIGPLEPLFSARLQAEYTGWVRRLRVSPFPLGQIEFRIGAYPDGARFDFHLDVASGKNSPENSRMLTALYYFNREPKQFSGGDIRLFHLGSAPNGDDYVSIPPDQNTLVVFPSWVGHSVTPIHCASPDFADCRFALNCWLHRAS